MSFKQYQAFVTAVDCGSITKASQKLQATQSGITHLIATLERDLGFSLMTRNKAGIVLTAEGKRLLPVMRKLVEGEYRLREIVASMSGDAIKRVRIGTFSSTTINWLPSIINEFSKIRPDVELSIVDGDYTTILENMKTGAIDMGFVSLSCPIEGKSIPLYRDEIFAVVPAGHRLASAERCPIKAFGKEPVICTSETTDQDFRKVFADNGIKPNKRFTTADDYAMIAMVEKHLGICMEPDLVLKNMVDNPRVKIMELEPPAYRTIALVVPYSQFASPLIKEVADFIGAWVHANTKGLK